MGEGVVTTAAPPRPTLLRELETLQAVDWGRQVLADLQARGCDVSRPVSLGEVFDALGLDETLRVLGYLRRQPVGRYFACDCVAHVLPIWQEQSQNDNVRRLVELARAHAGGVMGAQALDQASRKVQELVRTRKLSGAAITVAHAALAAAWGDVSLAIHLTLRATEMRSGRAAAERERYWQLGRLREYFTDHSTGVTP